MKGVVNILLLWALLLVGLGASAQCTQSMSINSHSASCDGGISTVALDFSIAFGGGDNSVTIHYDLGAGTIPVVTFEDEGGDMIGAILTIKIPSCTYAALKMTAWSGPSGSGSVCMDPAQIVIDNVVPVSFGDVSASEKKGKVEIEWNTHSENNNDRFIVERAENKVDFVSIGEVKAAGHSPKLTKYSFIDVNPLSENNYYRIKQIDHNGSFAFSEVIKVDMGFSSPLKMYPNPSTSLIHVEGGPKGQLSISNNQGIIEKTIIKESTLQQIDVSNLKPGMYFLRSQNEELIGRFIKQ